MPWSHFCPPHNTIVLAESLPLFGIKAPKSALGPFFRAGEAQKAFEIAGAVLGGVVGAF